jgi:hypothetical protein
MMHRSGGIALELVDLSDVYADLFDDDLDEVAANLDAAMRAAGDQTGTESKLGTDGLGPKSH